MSAPRLVVLPAVLGSTAVLAAGIPGPPGQSIVGPPGPAGSGEEEVFAKRVDFVTDDLLYRGEAEVGSPETNAVWRIRKIVIGVDGDVTETWASGTAAFDKPWTARAGLVYS